MMKSKYKYGFSHRLNLFVIRKKAWIGWIPKFQTDNFNEYRNELNRLKL